MKNILIILLMGLFLTGCNTISGIGRDLRQAGDAITGAAN
jgi:predicted small secreted protein